VIIKIAYPADYFVAQLLVMKKYLVLIAVAAIFVSCSSSKITSAWKVPDPPAKVYNKILVLGLINDQDSSLRAKMEEHISGDLKALGYGAISTLQIYGPHAFDKLDEPAAVDLLRTTGVDGIITVVLRKKEKEVKYLTPHPVHIQGDYYNRFWDYHSNLNQRIYQPGYLATQTKYFWETNFYNLSDQRLLYSAQTKTFEPSSSGKMSHEFGLLIVRDMIKKKIFMRPVGLED